MTKIAIGCSALCVLLAGSAATGALAQDTSHIESVKLYPGTAIVERKMDITAATKHVVFSCLPARLDESSAEITATNGAQLGELSISTTSSNISDTCANTELARHIKTLQHQKDVLTVRLNALDDSRNYLKSIGDGGKTTIAANIAGTVQSLAKVSEDNGLKRLDVQAQVDAIDKALAPLLDEQKRTQQNSDLVKTISVDVAANQASELHLTYRISGPGWTPGYRATLDTKTGAVTIDRLALVAQASGEDWTNVNLVLFAGQPGRNLVPREPSSWRLDLAPQVESVTLGASRIAAPPPPMAMMAPAPRTPGSPVAPLYDVRSFTGNYDAQFDISRPITVPSNGQKVSLSLGRYAANAQTYDQLSPADSPAAFLVAEMDAPDGIWLPGNMDLYRDNNYAGQTYFHPTAKTTQSLSFGQDELLTAQILPERTNRGSVGFFEQQGERAIAHHYLIESRHAAPVSVHVLEATPVSQDEKIKVESKFNLPPDEKDWQGNPGVVLWRLHLDAGKQQALSADYKITYPKDAEINGLDR
jgi:uncharacterized protein (TIGR02231 family)